MKTRVNLDAINHGLRCPEPQLSGDEVALLSAIAAMFAVVDALPLGVVVAALGDIGYVLVVDGSAASVRIVAELEDVLHEGLGLYEGDDGLWRREDEGGVDEGDAESGPFAPDFLDVHPEACPGCRCLPGDGLTVGCVDPNGCGYHMSLSVAS